MENQSERLIFIWIDWALWEGEFAYSLCTCMLLYGVNISFILLNISSFLVFFLCSYLSSGLFCFFFPIKFPFSACAAISFSMMFILSPENCNFSHGSAANLVQFKSIIWINQFPSLSLFSLSDIDSSYKIIVSFNQVIIYID